ncbi:MAG: VOC family protein [Fimbriimonadaceae bacterium]|nr:VOC family protein [Fimbriimonadaceae bacterium]QYK58937.1 MAG: VOC family protein [Fimbriimonadaceae bacterium]
MTGLSPFTVQTFVPYVHVSDVQASIDFYLKLGLSLDSRFGPEGEPYWARMKRPGCDLMLARASGPIDAGQQAVLFYLHVDDIDAFRAAMLASGLQDGGKYDGTPGQAPRSGMVFEPTFPDYMPAGEVRVHEPDGYVLLVGQIGEPRSG